MTVGHSLYETKEKERAGCTEREKRERERERERSRESQRAEGEKAKRRQVRQKCNEQSQEQTVKNIQMHLSPKYLPRSVVVCMHLQLSGVYREVSLNLDRAKFPGRKEKRRKGGGRH